MAIYKLTTEKEIRDMLQEAFMIEELRDYASSLAGFFTQKAKDFAQALSGNEDDENIAYKKYHTFHITYPDVVQAIEDLEYARNYYDLQPQWVEEIVQKELKDPTMVEIPDDADEDEIAEALIDIEDEFWNKYSDELAPHWFMKLYHHSAGQKVYDENHEFMQRYNLTD